VFSLRRLRLACGFRGYTFAVTSTFVIFAGKFAGGHYNYWKNIAASIAFKKINLQLQYPSATFSNFAFVDLTTLLGASRI
jgi:hypothetical protein